MLRRTPGAPKPEDEIDEELVDGVEAEFPWHVLVNSASCSPEEAAERIERLLEEGFLEGTAGDTRNGAKTVPPRPVSQSVRTVAEPLRTSPPPILGSDAPRSPSASSFVPVAVPSSGHSFAPIQRTPTAQSLAPVQYTPAGQSLVPGQRIPTAQSLAQVQYVPSGQSLAPAQLRATPPKGSALTGEALLRELRALRGGTSLPPAESLRPAASTGRPPANSAAPAKGSFVVDSPLGALIEEFSQGHGIYRWSAVRLREALEEELAGNYLQAVAILQVVLAQVEDPRIRAERVRLQDKSQRLSSGVYRSRALDAERERNPKEAAEHWRKVLEALPSDAEAALHAAKCSLEAGDLKQAAHFARHAVQIAPENVNAHRLLLRFYEKTGMEASAQRERDILQKLRKA